MKKLILLGALLVGCGTTTVVDRVEVPKPYWEGPKNIKQLPERIPLESDRLTPDAAKEDTKAAFRAIADDMAALIAENETLRMFYEELVKLVTTEPESEEETNDD